MASSRGTFASVAVTGVLKSLCSTIFTPACWPIALSTSASGVSRAIKLTFEDVTVTSKPWLGGGAIGPAAPAPLLPITSETTANTARDVQGPLITYESFGPQLIGRVLAAGESLPDEVARTVGTSTR